MNNNQALIVVDLQNDFLENGALAVPHASEIIEIVNQLSLKFGNVIFTQDWHPKKHVSFASNHPGKKQFDVVDLSYGKQILWPDHCVQDTFGAQLAPSLDVSRPCLFVKKGTNPSVDSYSAFMEADRKTKTELEDWLKKRGVKDVFVCGLATDFCVSWTALDAAAAGFKVFVVEDACRGINANNSVALAKDEWRKAGISIVHTSSIT